MPIKVASAPVSWGIYEFEGIAPKYPYTRVLDEIKDTGYTGIELGPYGYLPTDPEVLRAELDKRGLQLLSAFVPVKLVDPAAHEAGAEAALKVGMYYTGSLWGFVAFMYSPRTYFLYPCGKVSLQA